VGIDNTILAYASPMGVEDGNSISGSGSVVEGGHDRVPGSRKRLQDYGSETLVINL
jgi:hypothetical protein